MGEVAEWHLKEVGSLPSESGSAVQWWPQGPPALRGQLRAIVVAVLVSQSCPTLRSHGL